MILVRAARGALWNRRAGGWASGVLVVLVIVFAVAVGWFSEALENGFLEADHGPEDFELRVEAVAEGLITLSGEPSRDDWRGEGAWGLEGQGGSYGRLGALISVGEATVTREFEPLVGAFTTGDRVRVDSFAYPGDPLIALGRPFETVEVPSPIGPLVAWFLPGDGSTWLITVHGKDAEREEALRLIGALEMRWPTLLVTYRLDPGAPPAPESHHGYGRTEWPDLEAAARYALDQGADRAVLVGFSMGGGIVLRFLLESDLVNRVAAVVLDAPVLSLEAAVDFAAERRHVPGFLTTVVKWVAAWRFDLDWDDLDHLARSAELSTPILLFHGAEDDRVPVATSRALAEARPDLVTYVETAGAEHVRSWNVDPDSYAAALNAFLRSVDVAAGP